MVELATTIWADGPSSTPFEPPKPQIRAWGTWIEQIITAFTSNGGLIYSSLAALNADLAKAANSMAWVFGDPVTANNGVYGKVGASGTGSWTRRTDLPFSFIVASDAGAGTPNAIIATTAIPVVTSALVWLELANTNSTSPVTISFNGGAPLTVKTNSGNDPLASGLVAGMVVMGVVSGSTFRLISDQASEAIVAAVEAAADRAEAAASVVINLQSLGGDPTGAVDASAILDLAESLFSHIVVGPGTYLINTNRVWRKDRTYEFRGGRFINGAGKTQTGFMKVLAGTHDFIFGGEIVRGAYVRTGNIPYDFGWNLNVFGSVPTPEWFGAVGDGVADDQAAWHAAMHACSSVMGNSGSTYATAVHLVIRQGGKCFSMQDGSLMKALVSDLGQVLGIRGQPPVTASGEPAEWNIGAGLINISVDGADAINNNGVGISFSRGANISIKRAQNIGRKAFTAQYWVQDCTVKITEVEDASTEAGSTHGVVTLEGLPANTNFSLDGGVLATADLLGEDVYGNLIDIGGIRYSGYNHIVVTRASGNIINAGKLGPALGAGGHVILGPYAKANKITVAKAGNTERRFVSTDALSSDNEVSIDAGDNTGTGADGFAVNDAGTRNVIKAGFDHSNTGTTSGRAVNLAGNAGLMELCVRSCDSSTILGGTGTNYTFSSRQRLTAAASRCALAGGANWVFEGGYYDPGTGTGIQMGAAGCRVKGSTILGDGPNRVLVNTGIQGWSVTGCHLPGVNPEITVTNLADMWAGGSKHDNYGDVTTYQCTRMGIRVFGTFGASPEGNIYAASGSTISDIVASKHYTKTTGIASNSGWVVTGTQT